MTVLRGRGACSRCNRRLVMTDVLKRLVAFCKKTQRCFAFRFYMKTHWDGKGCQECRKTRRIRIALDNYPKKSLKHYFSNKQTLLCIKNVNNPTFQYLKNTQSSYSGNCLLCKRPDCRQASLSRMMRVVRMVLPLRCRMRGGVLHDRQRSKPERASSRCFA